MAEFSKLLTKTDIQKRLSLPTKCFKPLPSPKGSHGRDFPAIDESGFAWTFQCSTRKKGHPKPVLSKGWLAFVRHKELKVGDRVKFFKEKDQGGPATPFYRVEAEKEIKIFGVIFGYSPIVAPFP
ncbi:B3 domain-containing transcription factor NGA4-like [Populus alba x Populus x berolinensis]|uniref:B3 domain-containing transcription factor NGA4-like n=2 Tax=Populus TaxID=3689 RepID=A0A4V6XW62_POPAL|nr:B3 domain-containing transcription factor NGA4-like [Populus alba x Populus x berolinensis]KAJ6887922.1 B3 domain-containing transcription factor NGA4-like [Populus alba x Populus x berolinensis]KAJ6976727.1 B3 domain-containing transcription factor NGA4-like [Populus alba x Populus x berolinensis]TKR79165.1 B3 domain-containing transcription factor NGA4-like [Populus alba]